MKLEKITNELGHLSKSCCLERRHSQVH